MKLLPKQLQQLNQQQLQSVELLQMSALELEDYLENLAQENPVVDLEPPSAPQPAAPEREEALLRRLQWLEDNDRQNQFYQRVEDEEWDPISRVGHGGGLEETLPRFLSRQLDRMGLDTGVRQAALYLADCLDDGGYLRLSLEELSSGCAIPVPQLRQALELLRTLEPAGVGAENLSQCLELQLLRIGETGPALAIVQNHLEELSQFHYRSIAAQLGISEQAVRQAAGVIQELEPRPGAIFEGRDATQYIQPDVFVEEQDGALTVRSAGGERPLFHINSYYQSLLAQSQDQEVQDYLRAKIRQAEGVLWAIGQRESTLLRCAGAIVRRQAGFFREGPRALLPLRLEDIARELELHPSTVSRAVREKYLQCQRGIYPLNYFFVRGASPRPGEAQVSAAASKALLRRLIDQEDKRKPLSDQALAQRLAQEGCPISRRTVAKYREALHIASASGRRQG